MTVTEIQTEQELATQVGNLLRIYGWCKGKTRDSLGRHCIVGAVWSVTQVEYPGRAVVRDAFYRKLSRRTGFMCASDFNDHPQTRLNDVLEAVDAIAASN